MAPDQSLSWIKAFPAESRHCGSRHELARADMNMVIRTAEVSTWRSVGMPRGTAMGVLPAANTGPLVEDGYRHKAIGSLQALALALAVAAAVMTTGLMWVAL